MTEIEKVTNNQAKARQIYNSLIKDNIFCTGISKNLAIALIELGIDSSTTDKLSVEKLQADNKIMKDALTEIDCSRYGMQFRRNRNPNVARQALAAIGGDDEL